MSKPIPKFKIGDKVLYDKGTGTILDSAFAYHLDSYSYSIVNDKGGVDFLFEKDLTNT